MHLLQIMHKATLDGVMFRTMEGEAKTRSRNSCVAERYKDRDDALEQKVNYGCIKSMFSHQLGGQTEIIVESDWYEVVGVNARTLLRHRSRVHFLKNLYPNNMVFWPSDITTPNQRTV